LTELVAKQGQILCDLAESVISYPVYNANSDDVRVINEKLDKIITLLEELRK
jgi:hypothetical protein